MNMLKPSWRSGFPWWTASRKSRSSVPKIRRARPVEPNALTSYGLGIEEVGDAVADANVNLPTGALSGNYQGFTVTATGQLWTRPNTALSSSPIATAHRFISTSLAESLTAWKMTKSRVGTRTSAPLSWPFNASPDKHRRGCRRDQNASAYLSGSDSRFG